MPLSEIGKKIEKAKSTPLVTSVPENGILNIHGLCGLKVGKAKWNYTPATFEQHIKNIVKSMNSEMTNLFQYTTEQKEKWEQRRTSWITHKQPYKVKDGTGYFIVKGESCMIFLDTDETTRLTTVVGYEDNTFYIDGYGDCSDADIIKLFEEKRLLCYPLEGRSIILGDLGEIETFDKYGEVEETEKCKEILDLPYKARGEDVLDRCRKIYFNYLIDPSEYWRAELLKAYEAVPEHQRMYLGDMDTKDSDYQRILYTPHIKREV